MSSTRSDPLHAFEEQVPMRFVLIDHARNIEHHGAVQKLHLRSNVRPVTYLHDEGCIGQNLSSG